MKSDSLAGVDLRSAVLCIELTCNTVFNGTAYRRCPSCGSAEYYPLVCWLDRAATPRQLREAAVARSS